MGGATVVLTCPRCKKNYYDRIRWGEGAEKHCPFCQRSYVPSEDRLAKLIKEQLSVDAELDVME